MIIHKMHKILCAVTLTLSSLLILSVFVFGSNNYSRTILDEDTPHEHIWDGWTVVVDPTCISSGVESRSCNLCGHSENKDIPMIDHSFGDWSVITDPTCTDSGTESRSCNLCGHSENKDIPTIDHSFGDWTVITDPTCTESGTESRSCNLCGHSENKDIPTIDHSFGDWSVIVDPTCTETGLESRSCNLCGHSENKDIPTVDHRFGNWTLTIESTCLSTGTEDRYCDVCGHNESREVPIAVHNFDDWMIMEDATCTDEGKTRRYCTFCGTYETEFIPMIDHVYDEWTDMRGSSCTEDGVLIHFCIYCGKTETLNVTAEGHTEAVIPPENATCTDTGLSEGKYCSICFEMILLPETVPALGHDFSKEWTVDVKPTTSEPGQKSRHCSRCDEVTDVIEIAKLVEIIDTSKKFSDVSSSSWAKQGIDYVVSYGYMNGTGNGSTFLPSGTMTRAMIVSVLHRITDKPTPTVNNPFTDLEPSQTWYHDAVIWAFENKIVTGTSATTFNPTGAVTREQMATFLYRFAKYMGYDTSFFADLSGFPDQGKVGSWAKEAVSWANAAELITGAKGSDGVIRLAPQSEATREQVATILMRFCTAFTDNK